MASSHSDTKSGRSRSTHTGGKTDISGDEINLLDYFTILWRRKYFIVFGTVLPSLLVYGLFHFSPGSDRVTYTYDVRSAEKDPFALLSGFTNLGIPDKHKPDSDNDESPRLILTLIPDRFYSDENLDKLRTKLTEAGFGDFAQRLSGSNVQLDVSEVSLTMTVAGMQKDEVKRISFIIRDNLEKVVPMYFVKEHLSDEVVRLKTEMADIEEGRFGLELELERKKAILARLKTLASADMGVAPGDLVLHFGKVHKNSEYLPLSYQVQAVDVNIVSIKETIRTNQRKYSYYAGLLSLSERLLEEIRGKTSSYYSIEQFRSFLKHIEGDYESGELSYPLSAYAKRIENVMSANAPVVERPGIHPVPKDSLQKTGIVFVMLLMITTLGAILLEAVQDNRKLGS